GLHRAVGREAERRRRTRRAADRPRGRECARQRQRQARADPAIQQGPVGLTQDVRMIVRVMMAVVALCATTATAMAADPVAGQKDFTACNAFSSAVEASTSTFGP